MEAIKRVFKFGLGGAFGAAVGAGVAGLFAPQKGEELRTTSRSLIQQAKLEGAMAQRTTEEQLAQRFRAQVADDKALTGEVKHREPKKV